MRKASAALSTVDMNLPLWIGEHLLVPGSEGGRGKRPFRGPNAGVAREACQAVDRLSRRAPGVTMGARAPRRSRGRMQGQVFGFLFTGLATQRLEKGLARQGETETRRTLGHEPGHETHPHCPVPT